LNPGELTLHRLAGGDFFTCGITSSGQVKCWGSNFAGELGDGSDAGRPVPGLVPGLSGAISVAAGAAHACALIQGGAVKCWGGNAVGQLGDRSTFNRGFPVDVYGLQSGVKAIAAGVAHTCAIMTSGALKCWGGNSAGQLGDRTSNNYAVEPQDVYGLPSDVVSVALGQEHTCAVLSSGAVKCWGIGAHGENGSGTTQTAPLTVNGVASALSIAAGWGHTCALLARGEVKCWGQNWAGQLGLGYADSNGHSLPMTAYGLSDGAGWITAGLGHTCVTMNDGSSKCFGWNNFGQLGNGSSDAGSTNPPLYVAYPSTSGPERWSVGLAAGSRQGCAFAPGPRLVCWGHNLDGEVGDGTTTLRPSPVLVSGF
jgi:alpha-tubulin suppressor-like RCC1 family protein